MYAHRCCNFIKRWTHQSQSVGSQDFFIYIGTINVLKPSSTQLAGELRLCKGSSVNYIDVALIGKKGFGLQLTVGGVLVCLSR